MLIPCSKMCQTNLEIPLLNYTIQIVEFTKAATLSFANQVCKHLT